MRLLKDYPQASYGRLWGDDPRPKGNDGKGKLFERGTKCRERKKRQGIKLIPRDSSNVDWSILVTETEVKFCIVLHAVRVRSAITNSSSKQQLISVTR